MVNLSDESSEDAMDMQSGSKDIDDNAKEMPNNNNDTSDDAKLIWQSVPSTKRKRIESPQKQQKRVNSYDQPSTSSNNRYAALDNEDEDAEENQEATQKPPPIYIPNVKNINNMVIELSKVISYTEFSYKSLREGQVRLMIKSVDAYRKVVKYLDSSKLNFHTFQLKQERSYRVVIKGLHHTTPTEDIKAQLIARDYPVRTVTNAKSRASKEPLSMFFVELDPNPNNKTIYDLKHINHAIVKIEPPKRTNDLVQYHRCQQFGHTKSYCKNQFRCVKCGMDHSTAECKKTLDSPPRCVHCLLNHTASYKGCQVYQNLVANRSTRQRTYLNGQRNSNFNMNSNEYPQLSGAANTQPNQNKFNVSFSDAVRTSNSSESSRMDRLEKMMENLMNIMSMLMTKLCK